MASIDVTSGRHVAARSRLDNFLRREGLVLGVITAYAASVAYRLPLRLAQDAWLALVGGRYILHHGFVGTDSLTYWTAGKPWIDQQWLAQLASYWVYRVGGLKLFALTHLGLVTLALAVAVVCARRRGASSRAVAWLAIGSVYLLALAAGHVRAQSFAYPLFALVLFLLLEDTRVPSRRVLAALPVLALWANLHGSVVLGASLAALYGAVLVLRANGSLALRTRGGLLVVGSGLAVVATPWGTGVLGYYSATLLNPAFKNLVAEWRAPTLTLAFAPLYLLVALAFWLLGRCPHRFGAFERLALFLLIGLALASERNLVWLALAAPPLLAPALDEALPKARSTVARGCVAFSVASGLFACAAVAVSALRPESSYLTQFPARAAMVVARAAAREPAARIYANEQYADWLLMTNPELQARIAYDTRFELLSNPQLLAVYRWRNEVGSRWPKAADGAQLIVLALPAESQNLKQLETDARVRTLYRDSRIVVLQRPRPT